MFGLPDGTGIDVDRGTFDPMDDVFAPIDKILFDDYACP